MHEMYWELSRRSAQEWVERAARERLGHELARAARRARLRAWAGLVAAAVRRPHARARVEAKLSLGGK